MTAIADFEERYLLGIEAMDETHRELVDLVNRIAESDGDEFITLFQELVAHTRTHFAAEETMMAETRFPAIAEHKGDHARVLGELDRFAARLAPGRTRLAKAYVRDQVPAWFDLHARTMDSALAAHLGARIRASQDVSFG
jgi:hemerythrin-like metal-binding protein